MPPEKSKSHQDLRQELQELLDRAVRDSLEVDAVFVYDLTENFVHLQSKELGREGTNALVSEEAVAAFGDLRNVGDVVNYYAHRAFPREENSSEEGMKYATFQLAKGIINVYFFKFGEEQHPFAVCFVSATPTGLNDLLIYSRRDIKKIKDILSTMLN